jgi:hypothetical protein
MPCTITDKLLLVAADNSTTPYPTGTGVVIQPASTPIFEKLGGVFVEISQPVRVARTASDGTWTTTLPYPSETDPSTTKWQILLPDQSLWQGLIPEGIPGPLSLNTLKNTYGWGLVSQGTTAPVAIQGSPGAPGGSYFQSQSAYTWNLLAQLDGTFGQLMPLDGYGVPFNFTFGTFANTSGGQPDAVFRLGWNVGAGAGAYVGGFPVTFDSWERHWEQTVGHFQTERHTQYRDLANVEHRPISIIASEASPYLVGVYFFGDVVLIGQGRDNNSPAAFNLQGGTLTLRDPTATRGALILDSNGAQQVILQNTDGTHVGSIIISPNGTVSINTDQATTGFIVHGGTSRLLWDSTSCAMADSNGNARVKCDSGQVQFTAGGTLYAFFQTNQFFVSQKLIYQQHDGLGTTDTGQQGIYLRNTTAATGGATQQFSPDVQWTGYGWTGSASRAVSFKALSVPDGAGGGKWSLRYSNDEANYSEQAYITNAGAISSKQKWGVEQTVNPASSITIDPTAGETVYIPLSATAITTVTVSAGQPGQRITVIPKQDATGSRSIATTWTNVLFPGGSYTVTPGANKADKIELVWTAAISKWCASVALNLS